MILAPHALASVALLLAAAAEAAPARTAAAAAAAAQPSAHADGLKLPIHINRRALHPRNRNLTSEEWDTWLARESEKLGHKYADRGSSPDKRQQVGMGDFGADSYYFAPIGIGSPAQTLNVVLDTGSADFWLADASCSTQQQCAADMPKYDATRSSTYKNSNQPFQVQYGSGAVQGELATEAVSLAGYNISAVTFGQAFKLARGTIDTPASGIMGMGFNTLSTTGSMPLWQILAERKLMQDYLFSFELTTNIDNVQSSEEVSAGGVFTLGVLDPQQYTGDITWTPLAQGFGPDGLGYWALQIEGLTVNGQTVSISNYNVAAIDTGTTLIGGPQAVVDQIHQMIPGAQPYGSGSQYYTFPCGQNFNVAFTFGGRTWQLTNKDLNLGAVSRSSCMSSIFVSPTTSARMPSWIIGDSFLKTVFSAYGSAPPSIGFASLPDKAQTLPLTSVPISSGGGDARTASAPLSNGNGGDGAGGRFSFSGPQRNTDTAWVTASVDVPHNLKPTKPQSSGGGGLFGSGAVSTRAPWALVAVCAASAAWVLL